MIKLKNLVKEGKQDVRFTPEEKEFIKKLKVGEEDVNNISTDLMGKFLDFFNEEMPYGTMKARDGDPFDWVLNNLDKIKFESITEKN